MAESSIKDGLPHRLKHRVASQHIGNSHGDVLPIGRLDQRCDTIKVGAQWLFDQGVNAGLDKIICKHFGLPHEEDTDLDSWKAMLAELIETKEEVEIAVVGKYIQLHDAYKSIYESLDHAGFQHSTRVIVKRVESEELERQGAETLLGGTDGILVPGGFGMRGIAEVLHTLGYEVQGSDVVDNINVQRLRKIGIRIVVGHNADNLGAANNRNIAEIVPPANEL